MTKGILAEIEYCASSPTSQNSIVNKDIDLGDSIWSTSQIHRKDRTSARGRVRAAEGLPALGVEVVVASPLRNQVLRGKCVVV
jgi:hypothetical protein